MLCLFHNGNSRAVDLFKSQHPNLKFKGNWVDNYPLAESNCLYEICFADADWPRLQALRNQGVKIIRHITSKEDDREHWLPACGPFDSDSWLQNSVINYLSFADQIICDLTVDLPEQEETVIITTGRTANSHLANYLATEGIYAFETSKAFANMDPRILRAKKAIVLWRLDQWACLTSVWILLNYGVIHKLKNQNMPTVTPVGQLQESWLKTNWRNQCQSVLDQAMFFRYVLRRPIQHYTTEQVIEQFQSLHEKIPYNKSLIIPNHDTMKDIFDRSNVKVEIDNLYKNVRNHLELHNT